MTDPREPVDAGRHDDPLDAELRGAMRDIARIAHEPHDVDGGAPLLPLVSARTSPRQRRPLYAAAAASVLLAGALGIAALNRSGDEVQVLPPAAAPVPPGDDGFDEGQGTEPTAPEIDVAAAVAPFDHESNVDSMLLERHLQARVDRSLAECMARSGRGLGYPVATLPDRTDPLLYANAAFPDIDSLSTLGFADTPHSGPDDVPFGSMPPTTVAPHLDDMHTTPTMDPDHRQALEDCAADSAETLDTMAFHELRAQWERTLFELEQDPDLATARDGANACLRDNGVPQESADVDGRFFGYVDNALNAAPDGQDAVRRELGNLFAECAREYVEIKELLRSGERRDQFLADHADEIERLRAVLTGTP